MMSCRRAAFAALVVVIGGCAGENEPIRPSGEAQARAAAVDWAGGQPVDVVLTEYRFAPSRLLLAHGRPYVLRLRNGGDRRHTFTAPEFFLASALKPDAAASDIQASGGTVSLASGETKEIDVVPLRPGVFSLECDRPLHAAIGMTGEIVVE